MTYYQRRFTYHYRNTFKPLLYVAGYIVALALTLYITWLIFVIVILTDPGNPYNYMP